MHSIQPFEVDYCAVARLIEARGLVARGGFATAPADGVPDLSTGLPARAVVMVGMTSGTGWRAFRASRHFGNVPHPLDEFSREILSELAQDLQALALFPFAGPPWMPFQRWAARAEAIHRSPLGLLIHARHGLWHGYRGALAFSRVLKNLPHPHSDPAPCTSCSQRPCLQACPVDAFAGGTLDAQRCRAHLDGPDGQICVDAGCLARAACPVSPTARYPLEQRRFHMAAFRKSRSQIS